MARPGVMLYFDMLEPLRALSDEEKGRILIGILEYGKDGKDPEFQGLTALAWGFIKPRLDRDVQEYERTVLRRRYAAFIRERKRKNEPELTFEEWLKLTGNPSHHVTSRDDSVDHLYPNTNTNTTTNTATNTATDTNTDTNTNTNTNTAAAANTGADAQAAAAAERKLKRLYGELGQGVVNLSEYHIQRLLEEMGIDMFDHYVKKLSDFILREGASVKNHYQTILKWWTEDSAP